MGPSLQPAGLALWSSSLDDPFLEDHNGTPASHWLRDPCLGLLSLGLFPPLGAETLTPQKEAPLSSLMGMEQVQIACRGR